jgi:hypothetical protein
MNVYEPRPVRNGPGHNALSVVARYCLLGDVSDDEHDEALISR